MDALTLILGPVTGGVIGYITNALAIRMLFRPYTAKYIFGFHIPFTPGIIPKEKGRMAASIGAAISDNLMNRETLQRYLLSDAMMSRLRTAIDTFCFEQKTNTQTVREFLTRWVPAADLDRISESVRTDLAAQISAGMADSDLAQQIAGAVAAHVASGLTGEGAEKLLPPAVRYLGETFRAKIAGAVETPLRKFLTGHIDKIIRRDGERIVSSLTASQAEALGATPVCRLLEGHDRQIEELAEGLVTVYRMVIEGQLPRILAAVNIPSIIEERINEMDMRETERLIFQVMDRELKAIIWLGAFLGAVMGTVNSFF